MEKVYLIAGMGADARLFKHLDLSGFEVVHVAWIEPDVSDTLTSYAKKLIDTYHIQPMSNIMGVSLGGMLSVEVSKLQAMKNVVILSTIKSIDEAPWFYKWFKIFPVYRWIPAGVIQSMGFLLKPFFIKRMAGESHLFNLMLRNTSPVFLKWSMGAALYWDGQAPGQHINHIIGDADLVFDYRRINDPIIIPGGDHMMVFSRAKELDPIIRKILHREVAPQFL